ncbi:MAG TPA: 6-phosphogluconolactonase, partial [Pyrinomonadaceae bacterium]|nr:6-phosphogluconolactonase [Pyrinomonadaceae bacterium]
MIEIFADPKELAQGAAEYFVAQCPETVALSGGSTPKLMFQVLAEQFRDDVSWGGIHFFWSDERHVPPDHPESNYR